MCGRFVSTSPPDELAAYFGATAAPEATLEPNYNVAPTQDVFAVVEDGGERHLDAFYWGLVPSWAKDVKIGSRMINARADTLAEKNAYKAAFKKRRCLIPADGFYEWTRNQSDGGRDPWFIHLAGTQPLSFAGLWAHNSKLDVTSCTIITMSAGEPMAQLHDRQPAILAPEAYDAWMDPATPAADVKPLLANNLDGDLQFHRVNRRVNASRKTDKPNDDASMIGPINPL